MSEPARGRALVRMADDVNDLVELNQLLVGVAYRSLAVAEQHVPLPQFRAMALPARFGPRTVGGLADALDANGSTMTRQCDKLVAAGWVTRQNRQGNRREVEVAVTCRPPAAVGRLR